VSTCREHIENYLKAVIHPKKEEKNLLVLPSGKLLARYSKHLENHHKKTLEGVACFLPTARPL
jgi:hypothetical protein